MKLENNKFVTEMLWLILSALVGLLFTAILYSNLFYNVKSVNVLLGDMNATFVGWEFYRYDKWAWPLTYTSNLLYPSGISILYTDSIPIFSFILKLLSPILPEPFVFHGTLLCVNSTLMFYSGNLFFRNLRKNDILGIIGGFFMLTSSVFLVRALMGHVTLTTQWLIIFNLLLILKERVCLKKDTLYQLILIFISSGVQPYLAFMNLGLAVALAFKITSPKYGYANNKVQMIKKFVIYAALYFAIFLLAADFWGWFTGKSSGADFGFGLYSSNLLSLINPEFGSFLLNNISIGQGQYEGFAYLGVAIIIPFCAILMFKINNLGGHLKRTEFRIFYFIILVFWLFSLSNIVQIGPITFKLPYDGYICNVFRSSGRFIWPLYYFITLGVVLIIYDSYKIKKYSIIVLCILLVIRILDVWPLLISSINLFGHKSTISWNKDLSAPFWGNLKSNGYLHLVIVENSIGEVDQLQNFWSDSNGYAITYKFTILAGINKITINDTHLARRSSLQDQIISQINSDFMNGNLKDNTLYLVKSDMLSKRDKELNKKQCFIVDNYNLCSNIIPK